jgi:glycosyltransferase involved in cell wall biosynthesis
MGGSENLALSIIKNDQYFQHVIVVLQGTSDFQIYCEDQFKINFINLNFKTNSFFSFENWMLLVTTLRKIRPDLIQSYMFDGSKYARILGLIFNTPIFIYIVNTYSYKKIRRGFFNYFLSFITSKVIVNSDDVKNDVIKTDKVALGKIYVVESFANLNFKQNHNLFIRKKFNIKKTDYLFLFIARLVEQKGIDYLLEAFNICINKKKMKKLKLIIVGDGELMTFFINKIIDFKLTEHIFLVGEDSNLDPYLTEADAYVDSSIRSGLSVAAIKALEANLPTIMTDVGGVRKLSDNGKYLNICPPADSNALASTIINLISNKNNTRIDTCQYVKDKFSDVVVSRNIITLYKEALKV